MYYDRGTGLRGHREKRQYSDGFPPGRGAFVLDASGGGVEAEETPEQAVSREVWEETGLRAVPTRFLFDEGFGSGVCRCFLMDANETDTAALGYDPEESHLQPEARMLQGIGWHTLQSKQDDAQVAKVIRLLENS